MNRKTKKILFSAISIAVIAIIIVTVLIIKMKNTDTTESYRSIKVFDFTGEVYVSRNDLNIVINTKGMNLKDGDTLVTKEASKVALKLDDDKYIYIDENSVVKIYATGTKNNTKTSFYLESGSILGDIQNKLSEDETFDVYSANTIMSIHGTFFGTSLIKVGENIKVEFSLYRGAANLTIFEEQKDGSIKGKKIEQTKDQVVSFTLKQENVIEEVKMNNMVQEVNSSESKSEYIDETKIYSFEEIIEEVTTMLIEEETVTEEKKQEVIDLLTEIKEKEKEENKDVIYFIVNSYYGQYDGESHKVSVDYNGPGKVQYSIDNSNYYDENFSFTDAGYYTVYVRVLNEDGSTINSYGSIEITGLSMEQQQYNGSISYKDGLTLNDVTLPVYENCTTTWINPDQALVLGENQVEFVLARQNYKSVTCNATITVTKGTILEQIYSFNIEYVKNLKVSDLDLPKYNGCKVKWSNPDQVLVIGENKVEYVVSKDNYNDLTAQATFIVDKGILKDIEYKKNVTFTDGLKASDIELPVYEDCTVVWSTPDALLVVGDNNLQYHVTSTKYIDLAATAVITVNKGSIIGNSYTKSIDYTDGLKASDITLPNYEGCSVVWTNPDTLLVVGANNLEYKVSKTNYNDLTATAVITVNKGTITENTYTKTVTYSEGLKVSDITLPVYEGCSVVWSNPTALLVVGANNIEYKVSKTNYNDLTATAVITVNKGTITETAYTKTVTYSEGLKVSDITLPVYEGCSVVWTNPDTLLVVGANNIEYKVSKTNYNDLIATAVITVENANITDINYVLEVVYNDNLTVNSITLPTYNGFTVTWKTPNQALTVGTNEIYYLVTKYGYNDLEAKAVIKVKENDPVANIDKSLQGTYTGTGVSASATAVVSQSKLVITTTKVDEYTINQNKQGQNYITINNVKYILTFDENKLSFNNFTFIKSIDSDGKVLAHLDKTLLGGYYDSEYSQTASVYESQLIITIGAEQFVYTIYNNEGTLYFVEEEEECNITFNNNILTIRDIDFTKVGETVIIPEANRGEYVAYLGETKLLINVSKVGIILYEDGIAAKYPIYLVNSEYFAYLSGSQIQITFNQDSILFSTIELFRPEEFVLASVPSAKQGVYTYTSGDTTNTINIYESKVYVDLGDGLRLTFLYTTDSGKYYLIEEEMVRQLIFTETGLTFNDVDFIKTDSELPVDNKEVASIPTYLQGYYFANNGEYCIISEHDALFIRNGYQTTAIIICIGENYYVYASGELQPIEFKNNTLISGNNILTKKDASYIETKSEEILSDFANKEVTIPVSYHINSYYKQLESYSPDSVYYTIYFDTDNSAKDIIAFINSFIPSNYIFDDELESDTEYCWYVEESEENVTLYLGRQKYISIYCRVQLDLSNTWPTEVNELYGQYCNIPAPVVSEAVQFDIVDANDAFVVVCTNMTEEEVLAYNKVLASLGFICLKESDGYSKMFGETMLTITCNMEYCSYFSEEENGVCYIIFSTNIEKGEYEEFPADLINDTFTEIAIDELNGTSYDYSKYSVYGKDSIDVTIYGIPSSTTLDTYALSLITKGFTKDYDGYVFRDKQNQTMIRIQLEYNNLYQTIRMSIYYESYKDPFFESMPENLCIEYTNFGSECAFYHVNNDFLEICDNYYKYFEYNSNTDDYTAYYYSEGLFFEKDDKTYKLYELEGLLSCGLIFNNGLENYELVSDTVTNPVSIANNNCIEYIYETDGWTYKKYMSENMKYCFKFSRQYGTYEPSVCEVTLFATQNVVMPELPVDYKAVYSWPADLIIEALDYSIPDYTGAATNVIMFNNGNYYIRVKNAPKADIEAYLTALITSGYTHIQTDSLDYYTLRNEDRRINIYISITTIDENKSDLSLCIQAEVEPVTSWPTDVISAELGGDYMPKFVAANADYLKTDNKIIVLHISKNEYETYIASLATNGFIKIEDEATIYIKKVNVAGTEKYLRLVIEYFDDCYISYEMFAVQTWPQTNIDSTIGSWVPKYEASYAAYNVTEDTIQIDNTFKAEMDAYEDKLEALGYVLSNDCYILSVDSTIYKIKLTRFDENYHVSIFFSLTQVQTITDLNYTKRVEFIQGMKASDIALPKYYAYIDIGGGFVDAVEMNVEWSNPNQELVFGENTVSYKVTCDGYIDLITTATVYCGLKQIDYELICDEYVLDGKFHALNVAIYTDGVTVKYSVNGTLYTAINPEFNIEGEVPVYVKMEKEGYDTIVEKYTLKIRKPIIHVTIAEGLQVRVDGKVYTESTQISAYILQTITIEIASVDQGYEFTGWIIDGQSGSTDTIIRPTIPGDMEIIATSSVADISQN